jgi:hypothetical protein
MTVDERSRRQNAARAREVSLRRLGSDRFNRCSECQKRENTSHEAIPKGDDGARSKGNVLY